ncbi:unnamed protein product [Rotaria socialis]|uniref:HEAT repeat domain-containing protein n=2 Tax=Rotaria socialis TaxID=392032 RepID=A0A821BXK0_9BILA|nr:unnamed protein product [Rotaria socialis]CAF4416105.1 unnamed protein product [Rotaria socialis]CAF4594086.1 unnamed protein product [Rotaria socialis]CAF4787989.1 unnamed protein product [Rotaria socialis]
MENEDERVRARACQFLGNVGDEAAIDQVITRLVNALDDKDSGVRLSASEALGNLGDILAIKMVINRLINLLWDWDPRVRKNAYEALRNMGAKAATNQIIGDLLDRLDIEKDDIEINFAVNALENALHYWCEIKGTESQMLSKLYAYIRKNRRMTLRTVSPDRFFKMFFETGNESWLPLAFYVSLVHGNAVTTVDNSISMYSSKQSMMVYVPRLELIQKMVETFQNSQHDLEKCFALVSNSEEKTMKF